MLFNNTAIIESLTPTTVRVAVVYHGGKYTAQQAAAVAQGVRNAGGIATVLTTAQVMQDWQVLAEADALVFGSPTYFGGVSAEFKRFIDSTERIYLERTWRDKLAAGFTSSASPAGDKLATLQQLLTFALQQGMIWVGLDARPGEANGTASNLNRLGSWLGAAAQTAKPEDLDAAEYLGQRITLAAQRWSHHASDTATLRELALATS